MDKLSIKPHSTQNNFELSWAVSRAMRNKKDTIKYLFGMQDEEGNRAMQIIENDYDVHKCNNSTTVFFQNSIEKRELQVS